MNRIVHNLILDMKSTIVQQTIDVQRYDTGRKFKITLSDNGAVYQIGENCIAVFTATKPDGTILYNHCDIVDNTIEFDLLKNPQVAAAEGEVRCEIRLYGADGALITSPCFDIVVDKTLYSDESIESSSEFSALTQAIVANINAVNAANEAVAKAQSDISEAVEEAEATVDKAVSDAEAAVDEAVADMRTIVDDSANAFKGNVRGAAVAMSDVSSIEHTVGCRVKSINLFNDLLDYVKTQETEWSYENGVLYVANHYVNKFITLEEGKTYTFSCKSTKTGGNGGGVYIRAYTEDKAEQVLLHYDTQLLSPTVTFTMPFGYPVLRLTFYGDTSASTYSATYSEIMLVEGAEAMEYIPYVDPLTAMVTRCGKNLIPLFTQAKTYTFSEVEHSCDTVSNTIKLNGTAPSGGGRTIFANVAKPVQLFKGVTYTLQARLISGVGESFDCYLTGTEGESKVVAHCGDDSHITFTPSENVECFIGINQMQGVTYENAVVQFQLEVGSEATALETYFGDEHTPNADGTVEGVKSLSPCMTLFTDTDGTEIVCEYNRDSNVVLQEVYDYINSAHAARIVNVALPANKWVGSGNLYSQVVNIEGITERSQVDLTPSVEQLSIFYNKDLAFVTENEDGIVTVYSIGQKPTNDYTIQATVTEVNV